MVGMADSMGIFSQIQMGPTGTDALVLSRYELVSVIGEMAAVANGMQR